MGPLIDDTYVRNTLDRIVAEVKRSPANRELLDNQDAPITVIGSGNWLISFDRVGPRVLELAEGRYVPAEVELRNTGSHGLALIDHLRGQDVVIVVDACLQGGRPGEVSVIADPPLEALGGHETSVHQLTPLETLTVAKRLDPRTMPKRLVLLLVETKNLEDDALDAVCERVLKLIDGELMSWRQDRSA